MTDSEAFPPTRGIKRRNSEHELDQNITEVSARHMSGLSTPPPATKRLRTSLITPFPLDTAPPAAMDLDVAEDAQSEVDENVCHDENENGEIDANAETDDGDEVDYMLTLSPDSNRIADEIATMLDLGPVESMLGPIDACQKTPKHLRLPINFNGQLYKPVYHDIRLRGARIESDGNSPPRRSSTTPALPSMPRVAAKYGRVLQELPTDG
ncbi:hypothetical protein HDU98_007525 [Podochytrium sp. JEL0797]|nr:hypothetical protein HDU98_007525 [Podochytrium sp. JEL0797]